MPGYLIRSKKAGVRRQDTGGIPKANYERVSVYSVYSVYKEHCAARITLNQTIKKNYRNCIYEILSYW